MLLSTGIAEGSLCAADDVATKRLQQVGQSAGKSDI